MEVDKSDKLDELRLKVGMIADQVNTRNEFYSGIINTIGRHLPGEFGVALYSCLYGYFSHLVSYGEITEKKVVKYGDGMFSICSIRGKVTIHTKAGSVKAYAPFYDGHHLIGILIIECQDDNYEVTEEDFIFLREITRFIEVKIKQYKNSSIDNLDS
jgi:L-methionine (R)-S-oxide reductase